MIDELHPELSFDEGLSARDWRGWLEGWQTSLASWMQGQRQMLT